MAAPVPVADPANPKPPLPKGKFFQNGILIKPPSPRTTTLSSQRAPLPPAHLFSAGKPLDDNATTTTTACLYRGLDLPAAASLLPARTLPAFVSDFAAAGAEMADYSLNFLGCSGFSNLPTTTTGHCDQAQNFAMPALKETGTHKSEKDVNRKRKKLS
ncbi:hypothetical protein HDU78_003361 [Chytriomyces hyalinus]|nr:hypothetical protein HDU78_003361 [Chytriomyces hyalinus]